MPSPNSPVTSALCESRHVGTCHESRVTAFHSFSFTLLSKNASANHLESHSCKNKGLKVPCFHTLTKKGVGEGVLSNIQPHTSNLRLYHESPVTNHKSLRLSPLTSALTSKRAPKPFRCNTYEKHTQGEGGPLPHQPPLPPLPPRLNYSHVRQTHRH